MECNESGECKEEWPAKHGINAKSSYYWQRKIRSDGALQLVVSQESTQPPEQCIFNRLEAPTTLNAARPSAVIHKDGVTIKLSDDISDDLLIRIMTAVSHV
jgi:hypothetical protein